MATFQLAFHLLCLVANRPLLPCLKAGEFFISVHSFLHYFKFCCCLPQHCIMSADQITLLFSFLPYVLTTVALMIFCLQTYKQTFLLTSLKIFIHKWYDYTRFYSFFFSNFFRGYTFCQFHILPIRVKTRILSISLLSKYKFLALLAKYRIGKMWRHSSFFASVSFYIFIFPSLSPFFLKQKKLLTLSLSQSFFLHSLTCLLSLRQPHLYIYVCV